MCVVGGDEADSEIDGEMVAGAKRVRRRAMNITGAMGGCCRRLVGSSVEEATVHLATWRLEATPLGRVAAQGGLPSSER